MFHMETKKPCSICRKPRDNPERTFCRLCHNGYMREWRRSHPLKGEAKIKSNARAYANAYFRKGKIKKTPCGQCGTKKNLQMHHHDYSKPLDVQWLCKSCHLKKHKQERNMDCIICGKPKYRRHAKCRECLTKQTKEYHKRIREELLYLRSLNLKGKRH